MNDKVDIDSKPLVYYIIIALVILGILWLNYCSLDKHVSSNSQLINDYAPKEDEMAALRSPAVAGLFYSSDKKQLSEDVDYYLANVNIRSNHQPKMLIVPHAGYQYSAQTAGRAYSILNKYKDTIKKVILVGPSHHVALEGVAISGSDYFTTPLGKIAVDKDIVNQLAAKDGFSISDKPHSKEHSLEVQLPFLQKIFSDFKIIPLVYGNASPEKIASALEPYINNKDTIIIFSADLSHYNDYETAKKIDNDTATLINQGQALEEHMSCGFTGINTAILLAKNNSLYPDLIELINSGDVSGSKNNVVGYGSWMFSTDKTNNQALPLDFEVQNLKKFATMYGQNLMKIAKTSLENAVLKHDKYNPSRKDYPNELFNRGASFVTLNKNNELRGCIGTVIPNQAVSHDIAHNTYNAAMDDSRFDNMQPDELKDIKISISLLSSFERIKYTDEANLLSQINQGVDGLIIRDGDRQGLFLPSVWSQMKNQQEFLNNLKIKAGMSPDYWSNKIKVYRFRTVEIKENEN